MKNVFNKCLNEKLRESQDCIINGHDNDMLMDFSTNFYLFVIFTGFAKPSDTSSAPDEDVNYDVQGN